MVYSVFLTGIVRHDTKQTPLAVINYLYKKAFIKQLFHIRSKVSQNKTEQIKCNHINKNSILPPNNVAPRKQLWFQQSAKQHTK